MTSGRGCQSPWRLIKQLTSSLFPLWGLLSIVPIPGPPLSFHLGRATRRLWACLPPSEAWLDNSQKQAGPGRLSPPGAVWLSHTLTMPLRDPPHPTPQPTFKTRQHSPG